MLLQHPLKLVIGFTVVCTFVDLLALIYEQKRLRYITNAVSVSLVYDVAQAKKNLLFLRTTDKGGMTLT